MPQEPEDQRGWVAPGDGAAPPGARHAGGEHPGAGYGAHPSPPPPGPTFPSGAYGGGYAAGPPLGSSGPGSGLAVASLVLSVVTLMCLLLLAAWMLAGGPLGVGMGTGATLTGRLAAPPAGPLPGSELAAAITEPLTDDGADVSQMRCPDTPRVAQGVVIVCHGTIDDSPWAVVVFFEDERGTFTLSPL